MTVSGDAAKVPRLAVEGLHVRLGDHEALRGIDLALDGGFTALIGPNGAGKTTLLRALLGLQAAERGRVLLDGDDVRGIEPCARARRIAYLPQRSQLQAGLSALNVVAMGRFAHRGMLARLGAADRAAIDEALAAADAAHLAGRAFRTLSAGEQQRVLLARALATGAGALCCDEPTAALDVGHALALVALLRRLAGQGRLVVAVLHRLDETLGADRALLLDRGRIVADGAPREVLRSGALRAAYGVEPVEGGGLGWRAATG